MSAQESASRTVDQPAKSGFPLASLALLMTVIACLLASIDIGHLRDQLALLRAGGEEWKIAAFLGTAGGIGGLVAFIYTFRRRYRWRMRFLARLLGMLAGQAGGLILVAPGALWRTVFAVGVLLVAAILFRLDSD